MEFEFSGQIFEKYSNLMKICPVGADLFHEDGQTDIQMDRHDEVNSNVTQFWKHA